MPKITLPGPCYIHYRAGRAHISRDVYPDLDAFWSDLVRAYHQEMRALAAAGCTYLQIDETSLVKLGDPRARHLLSERGDDWRDLLDRYVEVINAVTDGAPAGMNVGIHICRSQDPSWQADVGYDPIAEPLFNALKVKFYFLEYDSARAGTFAPLRALPKDKIVVLGLVASKAVAEPRSRRLPQAPHRGSQPLRRHRAVSAQPAMRIFHQRHRAGRADRGDADGQARPHRGGGAGGVGVSSWRMASSEWRIGVFHSPLTTRPLTSSPPRARG